MTVIWYNGFMNSNMTVIAILLGASLFFNVAMNYMGDNIEEFETVPLPPKKIKKISTRNPTLEVNAKAKDSWMLEKSPWMLELLECVDQDRPQSEPK